MDEIERTAGASLTASARTATIVYAAALAASFAARMLGVVPYEVGTLGFLALTCAAALYVGDAIWRGGDRLAGAAGYLLSVGALVAFAVFIAGFPL